MGLWTLEDGVSFPATREGDKSVLDVRTRTRRRRRILPTALTTHQPRTPHLPTLNPTLRKRAPRINPAPPTLFQIPLHIPRIKPLALKHPQINITQVLPSPIRHVLHARHWTNLPNRPVVLALHDVAGAVAPRVVCPRAAEVDEGRFPEIEFFVDAPREHHFEAGAELVQAEVRERELEDVVEGRRAGVCVSFWGLDGYEVDLPYVCRTE